METMIRMNPVSGLFETVVIEDAIVIEDTEDVEETVEETNIDESTPNSVKCKVGVAQKPKRGKT